MATTYFPFHALYIFLKVGMPASRFSLLSKHECVCACVSMSMISLRWMWHWPWVLDRDGWSWLEFQDPPASAEQPAPAVHHPPRGHIPTELQELHTSGTWSTENGDFDRNCIPFDPLNVDMCARCAVWWTSTVGDLVQTLTTAGDSSKHGMNQAH